MQHPQFCYFHNVSVTWGDKPGNEYQLATEAQFVHAMLNPFTGSKSNAPCYIPSAYNLHDAREHDAQRLRGQFWAISLDVDSGNNSLPALTAALAYCLPPCRVHIHATASSADNDRRWRVLVMLAQPLPGEWYGPVVEAMAIYLTEHAGIEFDPCTRREGQFMYGPTKGAHYEIHVGQGEGLQLSTVQPVTTLASTIYEQRAAYEKARVNVGAGGKQGFVGMFNRVNRIEDLLVKYGYSERGRRNEWRSPYNRSGSYGTRVFNVDSDDEYFVSKSQSDADQGIGRAAPRGGVMGDAFDLFKFYEHDNDDAKAVAAIKRAIYGDATSGVQFVDAHQDPETGEYVAAGLQPLPNREPGNGYDQWMHLLAGIEAARQRKLEEDRKSAEEAKAFAEAAATAEKKRWGGDWLKEVPFKIEKPSALEWAAWHAPGLLGEIVRTKAHQASRHTLVPILAGAITALCRLGQGKFVSKYQKFITPTALMIYLVGDTGAGKGDAVDTYHDVIRLVRPENRPGIASHVKHHFASPEALVQYMADFTPHVMLIHEEAGAVRAANKGDGRQEGVSAGITNIFTAFKNGLPAGYAKTQGASTKEIHNPSFASLLLSTPAKLFKTIEGSDVESGFIGRYIFMDIGATSAKFKSAAMDLVWPQSVIDKVNALALLAPPEPSRIGPNIYNGDEKAFWAMQYEDSAHAFMDAIDDEYDVRSRDLRYPAIERALNSRAHEAVNRLATTVSIGVAPDKAMELRTAEWANVIIRTSVATVTANMASTYDGDQDDSPVTRIRRGVAQYFEKATVDEAFARGFGKDIRKGVDGHTELARGHLKLKLYQNKLKAVKISSKQVNEELDEMIKDGIILDLGKDVTGRTWLRYVKWT